MIDAEIQRRVERLLKGERRIEDLDRIFQCLRDRAHSREDEREIGDFVAHHAASGTRVRSLRECRTFSSACTRGPVTCSAGYPRTIGATHRCLTVERDGTARHRLTRRGFWPVFLNARFDGKIYPCRRPLRRCRPAKLNERQLQPSLA